MKLWLDDVRVSPPGWEWVKTVEEAKKLLLTGEVEEASLDHDLGACEECLQGMNASQWLEKVGYKSFPNCEHFGTGYTLVCWMEENNIWPTKSIKVHSSNPVGRQRMHSVIDKAWS